MAVKIEIEIHNAKTLTRTDAGRILKSIARQLQAGDDLWGPALPSGDGSFIDRRGGRVSWSCSVAQGEAR